ncbi:MAG: hypothetical protein KME54_20715 [Tolypothrix brevis GSE-NOS-MK-07-07A]|nr:hypothetical protein [Tolypothrix brevis GSE-NOS-MK-07-07A]
MEIFHESGNIEHNITYHLAKDILHKKRRLAKCLYEYLHSLKSDRSYVLNQRIIRSVTLILCEVKCN